MSECVTICARRRPTPRSQGRECARRAGLALAATWIAVVGRGCEVGTCDEYEAAASGEYSVRNAGPLCLTHWGDMAVDLEAEWVELGADFESVPDRSCLSRSAYGTIWYEIIEFRRHVEWDETW